MTDNAAINSADRSKPAAPTRPQIYALLELQAVGRSLRAGHYRVARRRTVELFNHVDAAIREGGDDA